MEAVTTAASRWLDLDGAANARDLGGLPLEGGGTTAAGVVLRSDNLQDLTPADVRRLVDDLGVAVVVDLRTGAEVALEGAGPLVADGRVEIRHRDLYPEAGEPWQVSKTYYSVWSRNRILKTHEKMLELGLESPFD